MSLTEFPEVQQRSQEWFAQRCGMVTASGVGALLSVRRMAAIDYACPDCSAGAKEPCTSRAKGGCAAPIKTLHAGRTRYALRRRDSSPPIVEVAEGDTAQGYTDRLVAERITSYVEPTFTSDAMWRGIEDEPRARETYVEHVAPVREVGFMVRQEDGWRLGFSPDGLVGDRGFIEIKSRLQKRQVRTVLDDEVPLENMAQIQAGLVVTGRDWCDYISYSGGMPLWRKRVYPDLQWHNAIVAASRAFEVRAAEMVGTYLERVDGLPMTERSLDDVEMY